MSHYHFTTREFSFHLHEVMNIEQSDIPGYSELLPDFTGPVLEEADKLAREVHAPLNASGDEEGCRLENGVVRTPKGFKEAFDAFRNGGWNGVDCDEKYGGQGLPGLLYNAAAASFSAANMALNMYSGLTHGAYSAIHAHGSDEQKETYLPKLVSLEWTGTMNLTEAHAGTDLGIIRTKAEPQDDGSYKISGEKIFISSGDHDLAENVIHLVLAKIPGGPEGAKGISLFIVPKFLVNEDGSLGERNSLGVGKIEEKMGIHGNSTCVMNYDQATGYLIGEPHKGLKYMFTMMNEARLGVGIQGLSQAAAAYSRSLEYARDRLQGRAVTGATNPDGPADPLISHPDIRRSLMWQKAIVEGSLALVLWGSELIDRFELSADEDADALASLLIPVIKSFITDKGFEATVKAQQIFGGHGYIEETGISQFVRDARITMIYEGANGIQALDLVGRKLPAKGGKAMRDYFDIIKADIKAAGEFADLAPLADALKDGSKTLQSTVMQFVEKGMKNPNFALAGASEFLDIFGFVLLGQMWLRQAIAAQKAIADGGEPREYYEAKLVTARFYMTRMLPEVHALSLKISAGDEEIMALSPEHF